MGREDRTVRRAEKDVLCIAWPDLCFEEATRRERDEPGPFGYLRRNTCHWRYCLDVVGQSGERAAHARATDNSSGSRLKTRLPAKSIYAGRALGLSSSAPPPSILAVGPKYLTYSANRRRATSSAFGIWRRAKPVQIRLGRELDDGAVIISDPIDVRLSPED